MMLRDIARLNLEKFKCVDMAPEYSNEMVDFVDELRRSNYRSAGVVSPWMEEVEREFSLNAGRGRGLEGTKLLIRVNDNRVVGLNCVRESHDADLLAKMGGNISYIIRPSERRKGYNKVNLFFAFLDCQKRGLKSVSMICRSDDKAAERSIKSMGGHLLRQYYDQNDTDLQLEEFMIVVDDAVKRYKPIFEMLIEK